MPEGATSREALEQLGEQGRRRGWNVVVSTHDRGYRRSRKLLAGFGRVVRTNFRNVLVLEVEDAGGFLMRLSELVAREPEVLTALARVVPAARTFDFATSEEFRTKAREIALEWVPALASKSFHVRLHRRGLKGQIVSPEEERLLDRALLEALEAAGTPGSITFDDPDAVIDIETVGRWVGVSFWTREDLDRYQFLRLE